MPIVRPAYPNELYHYGVKGMHWGIRRYQPYPKGYSGKGRYLGKRSRVGMFGKKKAVKHLNDEQRNWVVNKAPLSDVISYSDQLTTEERIRAANRIESERRLHSLRYSGALKKYNDITTAVGNTSKILKTGLEIAKLTPKKEPDYERSGTWDPSSYDAMQKQAVKDYDWSQYTGNEWGGIKGGKKVGKLTKTKQRELNRRLRKLKTNAVLAGMGYGATALAYKGQTGRSLTKDIITIGKPKIKKIPKYFKDKNTLRKAKKINFDALGNGKYQLALNNKEFRRSQIKANPKAYAKYQMSNVKGRINNMPKSAKIAAGALGAAAVAGGIGYGIYKRKKRKQKRRR